MAVIRHSRLTTAIWLLAIVLFALRIGGDHLHLCMDGREPPVTVHVEPPAFEEQEEAGHADRDIDLSSLVMIKKLAGHDELPVALLGAMLLVALLPVPRSVAAFSPLQTPRLTAPLALRPPPRGPPV